MRCHKDGCAAVRYHEDIVRKNLMRDLSTRAMGGGQVVSGRPAAAPLVTLRPLERQGCSEVRVVIEVDQKRIGDRFHVSWLSIIHEQKCLFVFILVELNSASEKIVTCVIFAF